ncbi:uncharacterized protein LOC144916848 [Branchiostoma floridae x Branchiostoma belcheri]
MANLVGSAVVLLSVFILHVTPNLIRLKVGKQYQYRYEATTEVRNVGVFLTTAKVTVAPLKHVPEGQLCQIQLSHAAMNFVANHQYGSPMYEGKWDFSKWLSFIMTPHGEVISIFYPPDEDREVLAMKKGILGTLSARLHDGSEGSTGKKWRYEVDEKGYEGQHRAGYSAERKGDHTVFKKEKYGHVIPNAKATHKKDIVYNHDTGVPHTISVTESVAAPKEATPGFEAKSGLDDVTFDSKEQTDLPEMVASSKSSMKFLGIQKFTRRMSQPRTLVQDTLTLHQLPGPRMAYDVMKDWIAGNLTCMRTVQPKSSSQRAACYRHIVDSLALLSSEDLQQVANIYIRPNINETSDIENREAIVDGFGALATNDSLRILTETVLLSPKPVFELVQKVLIHVAVLQHPPPKAITDLLVRRCFDGKPFSKDPQEDHKLRSQGFLVLGVIAKLLKEKDDKRSDVIVRKLEEHLEVFDPWTHRSRRSTMSPDETKVHDRYKANLLGALGNAGCEDSYNHVLSYLNTTEAPHVLRRHAIAALGGFHNIKAAYKLLSLSSDDDEDIQRAAKLEFRTHPKAKELAEIYLQKTREVNATKEDIVSRRKRDFYGIPGIAGVVVDDFTTLDDIRAGVDRDGFYFDMPLLEFAYVLSLGSPSIGSSTGVILNNGATLRTGRNGALVSGRIHDEVWSEAHIGILGLNFDFFRLRACLKLSVSYDIDILKAFGYNDPKELAALFDRITGYFVTLLNLVQNLQEIVNTYFTNVTSTFNQHVQNIMATLQIVRSARAAALNSLGIIDDAQLATDPNVATVATSVRKSVDLASEAIREYSDFYKASTDIAAVTLPMAVRHINEGIRLIAETSRNYFQSPKTAMKDVEKAVNKIQQAMEVILEARSVLKDASIRNDERPFWSSVIENADELKDELTTATQLISERSRENSGWTTNSVLSEAARGMATAFQEMNAFSRALGTTFESLDSKLSRLKEGCNDLKNGYRSAKSKMDEVFGPKVDNNFPRRQLRPGHSRGSKRSCPSTMGYFPSDGDGRYTFKGVDLQIGAGRTLVAPFTGKAFRPIGSTDQVTIIADELHGVHVIIDNVDLFDELVNKTVYKGESLGRVRSSHCQPNSIHLAMVNISREAMFAMDPTPYLEQEEMPTPQLNQECGDFLLRLAGLTILDLDIDITMSGIKDTSPVRVAPVKLTDSIQALNAMIGSHRGKEGDQKTFVSDVLGIHHLNREPTMAFSTSNLKVSDVIRVLGQQGHTASMAKLQELVQQVERSLEAKPSCSSPRIMTDGELRDALSTLNQSTHGSRNQLIRRLYQTPKQCSHLDLASSETSFCKFDSGCQSASCCVDVVQSHQTHTISVSVDLDPCTHVVHLSVGSWKRDFSAESLARGEAGSEEITDVFGPKTHLVIDYNVVRMWDVVRVNVQGKACNTNGGCFPPFWLLRNSVASFARCTLPSLGHGTGTKQQLEEKTMRDLQSLVEQLMGDRESDLAEIFKDIQTLATGLTVVGTHAANIVDIFKNHDIIFEADVPLTALNVDLFRLHWPYMLGPVPVIFGFGAGVNGGARAHATFHLRSMQMHLEVVPQVGGHVWGDFGIWLLLFTGKMRLIGYICETSFPMNWQFNFGSTDTGTKYAQYQVMVPFRLELRGILVMHLIFFDVTIVDLLIWGWSAPAKKEKKKADENYNPDMSPPLFEGGIIPFGGTCRPSTVFRARQEERVIVDFLCGSSVSSGKRSIRTNKCFVEQVKGRDYTEPAFQLGFHTEDERSEVKSTLCVGTYRGGCDGIGNEPIGGAWSPLSKVGN